MAQLTQVIPTRDAHDGDAEAVEPVSFIVAEVCESMEDWPWHRRLTGRRSSPSARPGRTGGGDPSLAEVQAAHDAVH